MSKWIGGKHNGFKSLCSDVVHVTSYISLSKTWVSPKQYHGDMDSSPNKRQVIRQKTGMDESLAKKVGNKYTMYKIYSMYSL